MKRYKVYLDAGHCASTPGKSSPDKRLREYAYARKIVRGIEERLSQMGIDHFNDHPEEDFVRGYPTDSMDLVLRTNRINAQFRKDKEAFHCFLISVHVNSASGHGWHNASGWTGWICNGCSPCSKKLAQILYAEAEKRKLQGNRSVPKDKVWRANFWMLRKSAPPAVLTENLFQDNRAEVDFLLSDDGQKTIIDLHVQGILKYIQWHKATYAE